MVRTALCLIVKDEARYFKPFIDKLNQIALEDGTTFSSAYSAVVIGLTRPQSELADLWRSAAEMDHLDIPIHCLDVVWEDDFAKARNAVQEKAAEVADAVVWLDFDDVPNSCVLTWPHLLNFLQKEHAEAEAIHITAPYQYVSDPTTGKAIITQAKERLAWPASLYRWEGEVHETMHPFSGKEEKVPIKELRTGTPLGVEHRPKQEERVNDRNWRIMREKWLPRFVTGGSKGLAPRELFYLTVEVCRMRELELLALLRSALKIESCRLLVTIKEEQDANEGASEAAKSISTWYFATALRMASEVFIETLGVGNADRLIEEYEVLTRYALPLDVATWGGAQNELAYRIHQLTVVLKGLGKLPDTSTPVPYFDTAPPGLPTVAEEFYNSMEKAAVAKMTITNDDIPLFDRLKQVAPLHLQCLQAGRLAPDIDYITEQWLKQFLYDSKIHLAPEGTVAAYNAEGAPVPILHVSHEDARGGFWADLNPGAVTFIVDHAKAEQSPTVQQFLGDGAALDHLTDETFLAFGDEDPDITWKDSITWMSQYHRGQFPRLDEVNGQRALVYDPEKDFDYATDIMEINFPDWEDRLSHLKGKIVLFVTATALESWDGTTPRTKGIGGSETCIIYLAEALARVCEVYVYCPTDRARSINKVHYTPLERLGIFGQADIAIASRTPQPLMERRIGKKQMLWLHDLPQPGQRYDLPNIDEIIAPSDFLASLVHQTSGGNHPPLRVIKHGITEHVKLGEIFPIYKGNVSRCVFGSQPERGLANFASFKQSLPQTHPISAIALYGTYNWMYSADYDRWRSMRSWQTMAMNAGVMVTGRVPHWMALMIYGHSDAFVYPSTGFKETFGLAPIEAYIAGAHVFLAEDCGATVDLLAPAIKEGLVTCLPSYRYASETWTKTFVEWLDSGKRKEPRGSVEDRMQLIGLRFWSDPALLLDWTS